MTRGTRAWSCRPIGQRRTGPLGLGGYGLVADAESFKGLDTTSHSGGIYVANAAGQCGLSGFAFLAGPVAHLRATRQKLIFTSGSRIH